MSAFIVSHDHIDALLSFAAEHLHGSPASYYVPQAECNVPGGKRVDVTYENATEVGRVLLIENERSVCHRYSDAATGADAAAYRFKPWPRALTPVSILKGCDCFDYQACETPDYRTSLAFRIVDAIRKRAIHRLPGYGDAQGWEFSR
jgi:hypothetical protein